jgi:pimeloyl-ACP methyl ester carboxylesterase
LVDVRVAPLAAGLIQDSRLLMLDGVGHVAHMEVPRLVARAVVGMLENGSGSSDVAD